MELNNVESVNTESRTITPMELKDVNSIIAKAAIGVFLDHCFINSVDIDEIYERAEDLAMDLANWYLAYDISARYQHGDVLPDIILCLRRTCVETREMSRNYVMTALMLKRCPFKTLVKAGNQGLRSLFEEAALCCSMAGLWLVSYLRWMGHPTCQDVSQRAIHIVFLNDWTEGAQWIIDRIPLHGVSDYALGTIAAMHFNVDMVYLALKIDHICVKRYMLGVPGFALPEALHGRVYGLVTPFDHYVSYSLWSGPSLEPLDPIDTVTLMCHDPIYLNTDN